MALHPPPKVFGSGTAQPPACWAQKFSWQNVSDRATLTSMINVANSATVPKSFAILDADSFGGHPEDMLPLSCVCCPQG